MFNARTFIYKYKFSYLSIKENIIKKLFELKTVLLMVCFVDFIYFTFGNLYINKCTEMSCKWLNLVTVF